MINEVIQLDLTNSLSDVAIQAYEKIKAFIKKIFSLIRTNKKEDLREEFHEKYLDFARKLDDEKLYDESLCYMAICEMVYDAIEKPDILIKHEEFFNKLYTAFDKLLITKIKNPTEYNHRYNEFLSLLINCETYYFTEVFIPSDKYDKKVCDEISSYLAGDLGEY